MPLDGFPDLIQEYTVKKAQSLSVDPSLVAMSVLAACSGAMGHTHTLRVKSDYTVSASLWCLGVAASGVGKTAVVSATTSVSQKRDQELSIRYSREKKEYDKQRKRKKNSGSQDDGPVQAPVCRQVAIQNFTVEALKVALSQNPRGLLALSAEGTTVLKSFGEYKQGRGDDRAFMCSVWVQ